MINIVNINEFALIRFLILIILGKKPYILGIHAVFPQLSGPLMRLASWAVRCGKARWAVELCPDLQRVWDYPPCVLLYDIFGETEDWQNAYYRFDEFDQTLGSYSLAYKQITCGHTWNYQVSVLILVGIAEKFAVNNLKVSGISSDMLAMASEYSGKPLDQEIKPGWEPKVATNFLITVLVFLKTLGFIITRTKFGGIKSVPVFLAADHMEDHRDIQLFQEAAKAGDILLVGRMRYPEQSPLGDLKNAHLCTPLDGAFPVKETLAILLMVFSDGVNLLRNFWKLESAHFYRLATLPFRRVALKGLFNRYTPNFFWGRDTYNADHILRHQELKRIGGISLGVSNEFPAYSILWAHIRYISFDRYYVYGSEFYEKYYAENWSNDMKLVPAASHSLTRCQLDAVKEIKPADIGIFTAVFIPEPNLVEIVRTIAKSFPERKIYLQIKHSYLKLPIAKQFVSACTNGLANVHHNDTDSVYDLLSKVRYSFSDPSSVIAEAVQMGVNSFALDISLIQKATIYRDYPDICISTPEEAVKKIRQLEGGEWKYPVDSLKNLIDLSGRTLVEAVCADLGLRGFSSAETKENQIDD